MDSLHRFIANVQILYLLFATVTSAPTGLIVPQHACDNVGQSAVEFNRIVKFEIFEATSGPKGIKRFTTPLAWMEAQDMCDPGTLRHTPGPCIKKMLDVLTRYKSFVKIVSGLKSCPSARKVNQVLKDLHDDMTKCVQSRMDYEQEVHHISVKDLHLEDTWDEKLLCQYLMERLFSFSILTARVFYLGDPANHAEPTAPDCALRN